MGKRSRCALLAVLAAAFMAMAVGSGAREFSIEPSNRFYMSWGNFVMSAAGETTVCRVTLSGSLHTATFPKVINVLIGHIYEASLGTCSRGALTILGETLPWNMRYESFAGSLPRIEEVNVRIIGAGIRVRDGLGRSCLARTTESAPYKLRLGVTPEESSLALVRPVESWIVCGSGFLNPERSGIGEMFDLFAPGRRLRLRLI